LGNIVIPFQSIKKDFEKDLTGKEILDVNGKKIGKVLFNKKNCGIAMVDKEALENSVNPKFLIDNMNTVIYDPVSLWETVKESFTPTSPSNNNSNNEN
jgi:hypothetical protein